MEHFAQSNVTFFLNTGLFLNKRGLSPGALSPLLPRHVKTYAYWQLQIVHSCESEILHVGMCFHDPRVTFSDRNSAFTGRQGEWTPAPRNPNA